MNEYETTIQKSYASLKWLLVGAKAAKEAGLERGGKMTVLIAQDSDFTTEGTLVDAFRLTGLSALFYRLQLKEGDTVKFRVQNITGAQTLTVIAPTATLPPIPAKSIFAKNNLQHIHIEPFRPESLNHWEPETETDVYMAFGVLQDNTDFQYCCGASQAILTKLGAKYDEATKPDAILIDKTTREYVMGEWKKKSSDFKANHKPEDVDVLVCWIDDETDRAKLPKKTVSLHEIAKLAAEANLNK